MPEANQTLSSQTLFVIGATIGLLLAVEARASELVLSAVDSGWYDADGRQGTSANSQNYIAGTLGGPLEYRNFFVFDLSGVEGPISSAVLRAYNPSFQVPGDTANGFASLAPFETYELFDVDSSIPAMLTSTAGVSFFDDLGSGQSYGSYSVSAAQNGSVISFQLSGTALADLNASSGFFAIGGALTSLAFGPTQEHIFAFTAGYYGSSSVSNNTRELVLTIIPEPATATLVMLGFATLGIKSRSRTGDRRRGGVRAR